MDKEKVLKILHEKEVVEKLPIDALKLYILFLVFASDEKTRSPNIARGSIDFKTLKRAFGEHFNLERLEGACNSLHSAGLVTTTFRGIEGKEIFARNGYINFVVEYELFDP